MLATSLAGAAEADCPKKADLQQGIELEDEDGVTYQYRSLDNDLIQVVRDESSRDGSLYVTEELYGFYTLRYSRTLDGRTVEDSEGTTTYTMRGSRDLPIPEPRKRWAVNWKVSSGASGSTIYRTEPAMATVDIGNCSYQAVVVQQKNSNMKAGEYMEFTYLPELGVSYLSHSVAPDWPDFTMRAVRIETLR